MLLVPCGSRLEGRKMSAYLNMMRQGVFFGERRLGLRLRSTDAIASWQNGAKIFNK